MYDRENENIYGSNFIENRIMVRYFKYWVIAFFILTLIFGMIYFILNDGVDNDVLPSNTPFNDIALQMIRNETPAYPPPLFNFMDASFNQ